MVDCRGSCRSAVIGRQPGANPGAANSMASPNRKDGDMNEAQKVSLAPACGLYCGICLDYVNGVCHGCGCTCGSCAAQWHAGRCAIAQCSRSAGLQSCADCEELPCTRLIQFTAHPVWHTHAPCIENLRRRRRIGTEAWLVEQDRYWQDPAKRRTWLELFQECSRRWQERDQGSQ